jgi:hypothetical protein
MVSSKLVYMLTEMAQRQEEQLPVSKISSSSSSSNLCKHTTMHAPYAICGQPLVILAPVLAARVLATRQLDDSLSR